MEEIMKLKSMTEKHHIFIMDQGYSSQEIFRLQQLAGK